MRGNNLLGKNQLNIPMRLFQYHPKDGWLIFQTFLTLLLPLTLAWSQPDWPTLLLFLPIQILLIASTINNPVHHHAHWPTFNQKKFNAIYELLLSAAAWHSVQEFKWSHLTHHRFVNDKPVDGHCRDPVSVWQKSRDDRPENAWIYLLSHAVFVWLLPYRYFFRSQKYQGLDLRKPKQLRNDHVACLVLAAILLVVNPWYAIWYLLIVIPLGWACNFAWGYGEHREVLHLRDDTTRNAVSIYTRWYNVLFFNSGYHQEHHLDPSVHWVQLPELTSVLPKDRIIANGMHIFNVPYWRHLKDLVFAQ